MAEMVKYWKAGKVDSEHLSFPTPEQYIARMKKPGEFIDDPFIRFFALILQRDFIIIHMHPSTAPNRVFTWIHGEEYLICVNQFEISLECF